MDTVGTIIIAAIGYGASIVCVLAALHSMFGRFANAVVGSIEEDRAFRGILLLFALAVLLAVITRAVV